MPVPGLLLSCGLDTTDWVAVVQTKWLVDLVATCCRAPKLALMAELAVAPGPNYKPAPPAPPAPPRHGAARGNLRKKKKRKCMLHPFCGVATTCHSSERAVASRQGGVSAESAFYQHG